MKTAAAPCLRAVQARSATRALTTSACAAQISAEAGSSKLASGHFSMHKGETIKQAWRRNLDEARDWRRRQAAIESQLPLYIPPSVNAAQPKAATPAEATEASLSTLLASGAALGHSTQLLASPFTPYVYGNRSGLSIIDLEQTLPLLRRAAALVRDVVKADGVVLFLGTRPAHSKALAAAKGRLEDNGFAVGKWMPGTLTNAETYFGLGPLRDRSYLPDLVVLLNPSENLGAIRECTARNVPTVGIVDSDTDPRIVTYPIPANAESVRTAELVAGTLSIAGQEGRRVRVREAEKRAVRRQREAEWRRKKDEVSGQDSGTDSGAPAADE